MVPIIIPYYRAPEKLAKCRAAIENQTYKYLWPMIRDNSEDNVLYTKAINEMLKDALLAHGKYALILTQDAYMEPKCLEELKKHLDKNPKVGIACPIQVVDGRVTWGGSLQAFPSGVHFCPPLHTLKQPFDTFWANGACMLLRVEMIREIGLMDEGMQFICSDSDYSFTARSRGWSISVVPSAIITHELDGSGRSVNPWLDKIKVEDSIYFTNKWLTGDLYRTLSFEGKENLVSSSRVKNEMYKLINYHKKLSESQPQEPVSASPPELAPLETPLETK